MNSLINLDKLNKSVKKPTGSFCQKMIEVHKENLKSINLYGSSISEDFIPKKSNINILFVFDRLDLPVLKKSLKPVATAKKDNIVPLVLTLQHIKTSLDTFPIEFLEIKENYVLVYGEDILNQLSISQQNIQYQCEQQLKGNLIRLYQIYLEIGMKQKEITNLMVSSITSLLPVFRNLIRLRSKEIPVKKRQIINILSQEFLLNSEIFLKIMDLKEGKKITDTIETVFGNYIEQIEKLGIEVDKMKI